jgi:TonB family protein
MRLLLPALIVAALLTGCATPATRTVPQSAPKGWLYSPPSSTAPITRIIPIRRVPPTYPEKAEFRREQGCVNVRFRVDSHGRPTQLQVFSSQPRGIFDQAAIRTMSQWRFRVTDEYGHPIPAGKNFLVHQVIIFQIYGTDRRSRSLLHWICSQPPPRTLIVSPAPIVAGARISIKKHGTGIDVVQMPTQSNSALQNGWVDVGFCIDTKGQVSDATIEASSPRKLYDSVALDAVKTWQFTARKSWHPIKTCGLHYHIPVIGAAALARSPVAIN